MKKVFKPMRVFVSMLVLSSSFCFTAVVMMTRTLHNFRMKSQREQCSGIIQVKCLSPACLQQKKKTMKKRRLE